MRFTGFKAFIEDARYNPDDDDLELSFDGPAANDPDAGYGVKTVPVYRGMAGQYIPPSPEADKELEQWNAALERHFKGDTRAEVAYLKSKKYSKGGTMFDRVFALQRMDSDQASTTAIDQAIDYAVKTSQRNKIQPPIVIQIEMPATELLRYGFKQGGQRGHDVFDIPADVFARYYQNGGKTMSISQAKAIMARQSQPAYA